MITMTRKQSLTVAELIADEAPKAGAVSIDAVTSALGAGCVAVHFKGTGSRPDQLILVNGDGKQARM